MLMEAEHDSFVFLLIQNLCLPNLALVYAVHLKLSSNCMLASFPIPTNRQCLMLYLKMLVNTANIFFPQSSGKTTWQE